MKKRAALFIVAYSVMILLFSFPQVWADSISLENKENFLIVCSTYDDGSLIGSYDLTSGDVLFVSWKGDPSSAPSAPCVYLLNDYQFHGWDYIRKYAFLDPASRGYLRKECAWEMSISYTVTSTDTYYVIIDNTNWNLAIIWPKIFMIYYQAVQNYPNSYYLTVKTEPLGLTSISGEDWYSRGYDKILTAPSTVTVSPSMQYRFDYWDVDGVSYGVGVNPITVEMNSNHTATAHYVLYRLLEHKENFIVQTSTHEQSLLNGSVTGYSLTAGDMLSVSWKGYNIWQANALRFYLLNDYQFHGWQWSTLWGGNPSRGYLIRIDSWEQTVNYSVTSPDRYYVIIECRGIHTEMIPSQLRVVSYDAFLFLPNSYYLSVRTDPAGIVSIPGEDWYTEGSNPVLTAPVTVPVSTSAQYVFDYWDVDGNTYGIGVNPITVGMTDNHTATAHYVLQYQITFMQVGLDFSATGSVMSVNGVSKTFVSLPYIFWKNNGSVIVYSYDATVPSSTAGKCFVLKNVAGPTSPIIITGPTTVTGYYDACMQYELTVTSSPITGIAFTINEAPQTTPYTEWLLEGSYTLVMPETHDGYVWSHWLEDGDTNRTKTIILPGTTWTGIFVPAEYTLSIDSSPTGVVFTVDGVSHATPWSETYDEGTSVNLEMPETHTVGDARYYWSQWNDGVVSRSRTVTMDTDITLTGQFTGPYYELTVTSSPITGITFTIDGVLKTTSYTEWLLEGSYTLEMPETHDGYVWSHWLEDGDTNRTKTIYLHGTTWTGVYVLAAPPVGGVWIPINKFELLAPWIGLVSLITVVTVSVVYVKHRKKQQN